MTEAETFMEELLQDSIDKELKLEEQHVDLIILELQKYEKQIEKNFQTAQSEMDIINSWALSKNTALKEKGDFLKLKLKAYIKERGIKTLDLAHGVLKLRQTPQRVEVVCLSTFLASATADMITIQPEQVKPNLTLIRNYINSKGRVPDGIQVIEGTENFIIKFKEVN
jgi:Bacteriophage Mu Gam like protein